MKTISLHAPHRQPFKDKRITRGGKAVQVTENGLPCRVLQSIRGTKTKETERRRVIDEILDGVLREKPSKISAAELLKESRR